MHDLLVLRAMLRRLLPTLGLQTRHLVFAVVGAAALLPLACSEDAASLPRGSRSATDPKGDGKSSGGGSNGEGYDPGNPTNQGPGLNPAGFPAVAEVVKARCSECHHPGTWLDLESGADAATADKIVETIENGTMPPAPRSKVSPEELATIKAWRAGQKPDVKTISVDPATTTVSQVLDGGKLATYKAALPKVAWGKLAKILESPSTLFWDKEAIPPAYQDTVGDGGGLPFGARFNDSGKGLIVPEGKKLFSNDGETWAFPFAHTAGADDSADAFIVNFMSLPPGDGGVLPIAYRVETANLNTLPIKRWNWAFPKGTVVGEIVMIKRGGGDLVTSEIRVRERFEQSWSTNVFRAFPTAATLSAAIKQRRPSWQSTPALSTLVGALENAQTLTTKRLDSPAFSNMVTLEGWVDAPMAELGDAALAKELLSVPFVGAYGTTWKKNGNARAFGPTGPASGTSIVPTRFDTGLLEVRESTCTKCHDQGGTFIGDLVDEAVLYGDIWGVDRIFSFHPFDPARIDASGRENRSVRAELTSIVVPYDAAKHPSSIYTFYRPAKP